MPKMATCVFRYRFNLKHFMSRLINHKAFWQSQQGSQAKASHGKKFAFPMTSRLLSAPGIASGMLPAQGRGCVFGDGLSGSHVRPGAPNLDWEKRCFWKVKRGKATRGGARIPSEQAWEPHIPPGGAPPVCPPRTQPQGPVRVQLRGAERRGASDGGFIANLQGPFSLHPAPAGREGETQINHPAGKK